MAGTQRTRPWNAANAGASSVAEAEITFAAAAARVLIAKLPIGAVITRAWVEVLTAFNAGTTNLVTVGHGAVGAGTADDIVDTVTEGTPGVYPGVAGIPMAAETAEKEVYVYYTPTGTAPTTGKARAFIEYVRLAANG